MPHCNDRCSAAAGPGRATGRGKARQSRSGRGSGVFERGTFADCRSAAQGARRSRRFRLTSRFRLARRACRARGGPRCLRHRTPPDSPCGVIGAQTADEKTMVREARRHLRGPQRIVLLPAARRFAYGMKSARLASTWRRRHGGKRNGTRRICGGLRTNGVCDPPVGTSGPFDGAPRRAVLGRASVACGDGGAPTLPPRRPPSDVRPPRCAGAERRESA